MDKDRIVLSPTGRIDATNAMDFENEIIDALQLNPGKSLILDFDHLAYISSAGLRVLLRVKKRVNDITLSNVSSDVYEILDMTGFTSILNVERKLRSINIEGCEIIGRGGVGTVYRIDPDTIVKVYEIPDALEMIKNEQRRAKQALLKGIPTAISYDAVRVGDQYGSVFEMINAKTFVEELAANPDRVDDLAHKHVDVIRSLHIIEAEPGELPDCRDIYMKYLEAIGDAIPKDLRQNLEERFKAMPEDLHITHGDIHMKNVMLSSDGPLLIDMDTLSVGNRIFDLADLFIAYKTFNEDDPTNSQRVIGLSKDLCDTLWEKTIEYYLDTYDEKELFDARQKIMTVGYVRFLFLVAALRLGGDELIPLRIQHTVEHLQKLLDTVANIEL